MTENARERSGSPDRFGYEWERYDTVLPESRQQLQRWLGGVTLESFRGLRVLDVGSGMGRNPYWMLDAGAEQVVATDVDERCVEASKRNLSKFPNAEVHQVSCYDLDAGALGQFDRVTSIGVVHHLGDPALALERMWACVKPGGDLVLWCYSREGNELVVPVVNAMRAVTSRLPLAVTHGISKISTLFLRPALKVLPVRNPYYRGLRDLSFGNVQSIVFDQLIARTSHYWTREQMTAVAQGVGGVAHVSPTEGAGWHVRVEKR